MNQQRLLLEYNPAFILVCLALGVGYAYVLYDAKHPWGVRINRILFGLRALLVAGVAFLLIGPILKLTSNIIEKPTLVFLVDNSLSVKDAIDSASRKDTEKQIDLLKKSLQEGGFDVALRNLSGDSDQPFKFNHQTSDLAGAIRTVSLDYEGKNLAGLVLLSDGIYNSGASPLYSPLRIPVYAIGLGDTSQRIDLSLKNLTFNKIAYQGNKFPLRAEVLISGLVNQEITASVFQSGKLVLKQTKNSGTRSLLDFDFQLDATEKGLQRIDVVVESSPLERNVKNNRAAAFIEVVEGKKKILVIAPAPHPDIKSLRAVIEKNSNYEFILHIPGVKEVSPSLLQPGKADLVIFHEVMDLQGKTADLFARLTKGPSSVLMIVGNGSNVASLQAGGIPMTFERAGQWDEVTPVINLSFRDFSFSENSNAAFSKFPPVAVPFGRFSFPTNANILLFQQIGSVPTDRPMVFTYDDNGHKSGVLIGEGIWRWRLNEFSESEKTEVFDDVFTKLIQYLSTHDDKRKFRSFPIQNEFSDAETVIFESQVYNDLFEQVYGNTVALEIRNEQGGSTVYSYVTSAGGSRYRLGALKEGVYKYKASTTIGGKPEEVRGEFLVKAQSIESQNLTADFGLLRKMSANTGGRFYSTSTLHNLSADLKVNPAKGLIHSEDSFNPLINLKLVFFLLLMLVSVEWFLRKYLGAY
jgi:hypothetical protein